MPKYQRGMMLAWPVSMSSFTKNSLLEGVKRKKSPCYREENAKKLPA